MSVFYILIIGFLVARTGKSFLEGLFDPHKADIAGKSLEITMSDITQMKGCPPIHFTLNTR